MTHGATFLKGNYELPRGPVKLSRERWEMLHNDGKRSMRVQPNCIYHASEGRVTVTAPTEIDGVIFLPAEYVPGGAERVARVQRLSPPPCA